MLISQRKKIDILKNSLLLDSPVIYLINSDTIFAEFKHNGIPPPG